MNYKVLKRPMFRIGGGVDSQGTGITSGMDTPRKNYSHGGAHDYPYYRDLIPGMFAEQKKALEGYKGLIAGTTLIKGADALRNVQSIWDIPGAVGSPEMLSAIGEGLISQKGVDVKIGQAGLEEATIMAKLLKPEKHYPSVYEIKKEDIPLWNRKIKILTTKRAELADQYKDDKTNLTYKATLELIDDKLNELYELKNLAKSELAETALDVKEKAQKAWEEYGGVGAMPSWFLENYKEKSMASGGVVGRKNYQEGVGPNIMDQGAAVQPAAVQQQPGQQDPYQILRQRLPAEVPDEVVRLIAYNKEAFQDFANIQTQDDITAFNDKYGVSLVIDVGSV